MLKYLYTTLLRMGNISMVCCLLITGSTAYGQSVKSREYFVKSLQRIADPVLLSISEGELKAKMPVEVAEQEWGHRADFAHLEAFGRLLSGMAPWLELGPDNTPEGELREKYIKLALNGIKQATDPGSPDFMNFNKDKQPVVDAAFLAQAMLRAPNQLWDRLDPATRHQLVDALKSTRSITPYYSNWLLFSAMIEAALLRFDEGADLVRIDYAINKHMEWYLGDGMYGDGDEFHWDYYNSFVIQPMMVDIMRVLVDKGIRKPEQYQQVLQREQRYAAIQERLISPEGTYPPIGRSLAYRFGAFQALAQISLLEQLPEDIFPSQVRSALQTVVQRQLEAAGTFDDQGWLTIGFCGHQRNIAEGYICTGSLYLCSEVFLILGLAPDNEFWSDPARDWTQKAIWSGKNIPIDHAIRD